MGRSGMRQECLLVKIVLKVLASVTIQEKETKEMNIKKEEVKFLCTGGSFGYAENPNKSTQRPLEVVREYNNIAGYKISI